MLFHFPVIMLKKQENKETKACDVLGLGPGRMDLPASARAVAAV